MSFSYILPLLWLGSLAVNASRPVSPPAGGTYRALIIAVGDYPRIGGWDKLSSAQDAVLIQDALRARGFNDVQLLVDGEATKAGIVQAFEALTARSQPGDLVLLHYSGHGQQVWDHDDPSNDRLRVDELDRFDESLVPYDARDTFRPGVYEGENHLVDDEISGLLTDLRARLGAEGQLLFTVDACYSGSISRSANLAKVRGTGKVIRPEAFTVSSGSSPDPGSWSETFVTSDQPLAPMAVISAARADQPNYETTGPAGQGVGSLSLALSRTFLRPFDEAPSLGTFFRYIEADMAREVPYQSPQLEGQTERQLFGTALIDPGGFPVLSFGQDNKTATLRAGTLAGLFPGTSVRLVPDGGSAAEGITGRVLASQSTTTTLQLDTPVPDPDPVAWKARVEDRFLLFRPVKLAVDVTTPALEQALQAAMTDVPRLERVEQGAELLLHESGEGQLSLSNLQEEVLATFPSSPPDRAVSQALSRIEDYARAQYFWALSGQPATGGGLELQVVPVALQQQGNTYTVAEMSQVGLPPAGGVLDMSMDAPFIFRVANRGDRPAYLHIMGVDARDDVFLLLPDARTAPAELVVAPDSVIHLSRPEWIFQTAEPPGKQLFLALASPDPIDLRPVFRQLSGPTRSAAVPEGDWLSELLFGRSRSAGLGAELQTASAVVDIAEE